MVMHGAEKIHRDHGKIEKIIDPIFQWIFNNNWLKLKLWELRGIRRKVTQEILPYFWRTWWWFFNEHDEGRSEIKGKIERGRWWKREGCHSWLFVEGRGTSSYSGALGFVGSTQIPNREKDSHRESSSFHFFVRFFKIHAWLYWATIWNGLGQIRLGYQILPP